MNWRKWNNCIHRDLGYLCFGLTIIYAISGVAVNHVHQWNPSYHIDRTTSSIGPIPVDGRDQKEIVAVVLQRLDQELAVQNSFQPDPHTLQIFAKDVTLTVNLNSGTVRSETVRNRPILRQINFLHLNHPKKLWTWCADLYAIALGILALTGLFVLRGTKGISGRGAWLTALGILLPIGFLWLYF